MELLVGQHAGFCFGVQSAVRSALDAASRGACCVSLGPLTHNEQVLARLREAGIAQVDTLQDVTHGAVVIRSHGVGPDIYRACEARGLEIIDATCPFVRRVHELVDAYSQAGKPVIIIGQPDHPEVQGTAAWCHGNARIVETEAQADALPPMPEALVVAQTTLPPATWAAVTARLMARMDGLVLKDTICSATEARQAEARTLSAQADAMLVVGSRASANTCGLYETCKRACPRTLLVEDASEIPADFIPARDAKIAITAGASTPDWVLKEVITRMNDMEQQEMTNAVESSFLADIEATLVTIRPGQTVTGKVVQISDDEVSVNIGYKSDGLIKRGELVNSEVNVGDEIDVEVVKLNDGDGYVLLSQRNIVNRKSWEALMALYDEGKYVEGVGREAVKGGLLANVMGVRAFVPASHLSKRYVEKIEDFVGKTMMLKIIEVDKAKKRIVCSRKAVLIEEEAGKKQKAWEKLKEGEVITGIVRRLTDFGAFVDIGGVDGLVHVTDLSWGRVKHPSEVVTPGQEIPVKILSLDPERERVQLGYKQTQPRPWDIAEEKYPAGCIVEGKVVRITTFGAFLEMEPGLDGLVHISQCALTRIAKVEDAVQVGQIARVKVLGVDAAAKRISLSIRAALEEEAFNYSDELPGDFAFGEETEAVPSLEDETVAASAEEPADEPVAEVASMDVPVPEEEPVDAPVLEDAPVNAPTPAEEPVDDPAPEQEAVAASEEAE